MSEYDKQRTNGAAQIIARLKDLAQEAGVELDTCEWDGGGAIVEHARHELVAKTNAKSASAIFSDEQLADYPEKVGTAPTEAMLRELVRRLG